MLTDKKIPVIACCQVEPAPKLKDAAALADVFRALSDETRLRILALLRDGEVCVCHIQGGLRLPQPTVSRHLAYLRKSGLVEARREGVWMHYRLAAPSSAVVREVVDAALHALTHSDITATDLTRMRKSIAATPAPA
jgi:ArsR family transcriptional regulator